MELPKTCRIAAFVCLICQTPLHMTRLGKDHTGRLQSARVLASEFVCIWLSATNTSILLGFFSSKGFFSLPNFLHGIISKVTYWLKKRLHPQDFSVLLVSLLLC